MKLTFIRKSIATKPLVIAILLCTLSLTTKANGNGEIVIPSGTQVPIQTTETIKSTGHQEGDKIPFKVTSDVVVNGQVVIRGGTAVEGTVKSITKRKGVGKPGAINIDLTYAKATDGSNVGLSGCTISKVGKERRGLALGLGLGLGLTCGLIFLACLAVKGKPAIINAGYSTSCSVATSTTIRQ